VSGAELEDIRFVARSGEVVGLAGLEGAGVSALLNILFGTRKARAGAASFPDSGGLPRNATEAARRGVCMVPADRRRNGLMLDRSILFNISQVVVGALRDKSPFFNPTEARARAKRQIAGLRIKTRSPDTLVNHLSGGNQQKVVVGKWLEIAPTVILLDDPTRGVDIGAKREIYELIRQMSADGRIVLFSSTELPELIGLCDRILVLYRGRLVGEVAGGSIDNRTLLHLINTGERPTPTGTTLQ
jgi:ribose transport system ATP-binding protein